MRFSSASLLKASFLDLGLQGGTERRLTKGLYPKATSDLRLRKRRPMKPPRCATE
jgi:hypothetical protein